MDDPQLSDDQRVLRRVPPDWVVIEQDRPRSQNFHNHADGSGTSVDVWELNRNPVDMIQNFNGFGVVSLSIGQIRDIGIAEGHHLGVIRWPLKDNPRHAHIQGRKTRKIRGELARRAQWEIRPESR